MLTERRMLTTEIGEDRTKPVCSKVDPSTELSQTFSLIIILNIISKAQGPGSVSGAWFHMKEVIEREICITKPEENNLEMWARSIFFTLFLVSFVFVVAY